MKVNVSHALDDEEFTLTPDVGDPWTLDNTFPDVPTLDIGDDVTRVLSKGALLQSKALVYVIGTITYYLVLSDDLSFVVVEQDSADGGRIFTKENFGVYDVAS